VPREEQEQATTESAGHEQATTESAGHEQATTESPSAWPADTEIVFAPGGTRVMLTLQRPLIRTIVQDAIEELRATLVFNNAFPDGILAMSFIRHTLNVAAGKHCPAALSVCRQLIHDEDYALKLVPVVSSPSRVEDHKTDSYSSFVLRFLFSAARSKTSATQSFWQSSFPWHRQTLLTPFSGNCQIIITRTRI
jgi:hypothetical protein